MLEINDTEIVLRLVLIVFLSSIIGFERELRGRAAGLRTHVLVGLSSCLLMLVSLFAGQAYGQQHLFDPGRIAASVVAGIGFLCAGLLILFLNRGKKERMPETDLEEEFVEPPEEIMQEKKELIEETFDETEEEE